MKIALNTDIFNDTGCPAPYLRAIAEAGFTHIHWCHQWSTDFLYGDAEIRQIKVWFQEYGLTLLDIHGSVGPEKNWFASEEYMRAAGVELVANRMRMFRALEGEGALMMHLPCVMSHSNAADRANALAQLDNLRRSLDELMPLSRELHVPIAVENFGYDTFEIIESLLKEYPEDFLGLCYDSGHGHIGDDKGLDHLEANKARLMALHIHDNDSTCDQHQPPFYGTLDWERFASILKASPYPRPISFELSGRHTPFSENLDAFVADAYQRCRKFTLMVRGNE